MNDYSQQMTAPTLLQLFDTTREQRSSFVEDVINRLDEVNPLTLHLQLKSMEDIIEAIKDRPEYKSAVLSEADKYTEKSFEFHKSEITKIEAGVKYDFQMCGDSEWEVLDAQLKGIKSKLAAREKFLKTIPASGLEIVDPVDNKKITLYPPQKTSTSTIKVKFL